ncbi:MAG: hypothetical protein JW709_08500 [Sedimentisphaerales bacterium]|nr:hypothetical protein [Sedimentisphaerales bacterium]
MARLDDPDVKTAYPLRIQRAIQDCFRFTGPMRENRLAILDRYAGGYYSHRLEAKSRPLNMIWRYINILTPFLAAQNPKSLIRARVDSRLSGFARTMELALDHLRLEIAYRETLRTIVRDALVGIGVSKVGMTPASTIEIGGHTYQIGQPYFQAIDFDDFFFDIAARGKHDFKIVGNRYRLPLWYIADSGLFKNYDKLEKCVALYGSTTNPETLTKEGVGDPEYHELQEYVELFDVWMPDEQVLVTLPAEGQGEKFLREVDDFPETGPYDLLTFYDMPGQPIPIPPAYAILDLDDQLNRLMRKLQVKIEGEKTVLAYEGAATRDADRIVQAADNQSVRVENIDRIKEVKFGGADPHSLDVAQWLRNHVSEQGGNIDSIGGLRTEAQTLGQEQLIQGNATRPIDDMVWQVHFHAKSVDNKLMWYLWHDPLIEIPLVKEVKGVGPIRVVYSQEAREGDFLDYNIDIVPYSMQRITPETGYLKLLQFVSQMVLPVTQLAAAQGMVLNVDELIQLAGRYLDIPNLDRLWLNGQPTPGAPGPYQPVQGQAVSKSPGQPDGRLGLDDGLANFIQQQTRAGGAPSPPQGTKVA